MDHGWDFDEVKTGQMGGASAARTYVLASEATLQLASLDLTPKGRGAFDRRARHFSQQTARFASSNFHALAKQVRTSSSKIAHVKILSMIHNSL